MLLPLFSLSDKNVPQPSYVKVRLALLWKEIVELLLIQLAISMAHSRPPPASFIFFLPLHKVIIIKATLKTNGPHKQCALEFKSHFSTP